ncbi:hypothetical protein AMTRI_Chr06g197370 [Amborella trichopoda]
MEKVPDEHELTQNLEKKNEQIMQRILVTVEDMNPQKVQDTLVLDSETRASDRSERNNLSLDIGPQKIQDIPVIHVTKTVEGLVNPLLAKKDLQAVKLSMSLTEIQS